ncbi:TMAO reductase system periplasmic protein TorT [Betaproteobacteria bacterium]|nr:TMAO reductase system periplasmic protein TorT [Betaproteobacteria bacterium]GHU08502.1 TMAO reductase system periplasmic protein TorT [Betaproteobacteria bacterium]
MNRFAPKAIVATFAVAFAPIATAQTSDWFPLQVNAIAADGTKTQVAYTPQPKASKAWKLCTSFPTLKDPFWLAADYGFVEEATRQGVQLQVLDAGGYTQLANQISQIENCVAGGAEAVIIGAISQDGLGNLLGELKKKNIPVIDVYNGINSTDVVSHILTNPHDEGERAGQYLAAKFPQGGKTVKVGWFPGPAGAGFVELFNAGFLAAIKDSGVQIVETKFGDTSKEVQTRLIEDMLQTHHDLDYIVGNAVTAEAAVAVLRARDLAGKIKVTSVYMTPGVLQHLKAKRIEAAGSTPVVLVGRIAVDQAVRALEKKELMPSVAPIGRTYTQNDIGELKIDTVLTPPNYKPVFKVSQ